MIRDGILYSDIFDGPCYLARYPDVAADGKYNTPEKALTHWVTFGELEGRIPGCLIGPAPAGSTDTPPITNDSDVPAPSPTNNSGGISSAGIIIAIAGFFAAMFAPEIKKFLTGKRRASVLIPAFLAIGSSYIFAQSIQGFGSQATGGSAFPLLYHVTNLNSTGTGSLSNGIGSNRTIVFDIGGEINFRLVDPISNITIDGSSAPFPGITLNSGNIGDVFSLDGTACHNVIVKYIRFKNANGDGFNIVNGANNIAFDHCSTSGNRDGNGDITSGAKNVTIQYCIFGPGAVNSSYAGEMLIAYSGTTNISVHHNIFYTSTPGSVGERCPLVHSSDMLNRTDLMVDFRNNIVYKWGRNNGAGSGYGTDCAYGGTAMIVSNYYYSVSSDSNAIVIDGDYGSTPRGTAFISGNVSGNGIGFPASNHSSWSIPVFAQVQTQDACTAAFAVKQQAGCRPLDATDGNIISQLNLINCSTGTPVLITYFRYDAESSLLQWQTATEINNDRFEVQESLDGITWETIGTVKSKTADGNSSISIDYDYKVM